MVKDSWALIITDTGQCRILRLRQYLGYFREWSSSYSGHIEIKSRMLMRDDAKSAKPNRWDLLEKEGIGEGALVGER